ncbi:serine/threonine protein kinase [Aliikangiella sp. G2MR2-5]|uniref:serine/threonine protein kinase n=1 Tax=Aliikangiella sp. G2MR2-5 TaxID=2788943 RepID=UPI0018ABDA7E|nr:serine/threonine protein kinase [Aliikangiella sp. G2MR2-5]
MSQQDLTDINQDFYRLTPDQVLDAIESMGLEPEAALLPLNSYENRVYQFKDYNQKRFVVKFYRPNRWSDEQIKEEHEFSKQLADNEVPVVAPLEYQGQSLFKHSGFRFAVFESKGGRNPNMDDKDTLTWIGRFLGRIHLLGEAQSFNHRPLLTLQDFGFESVEYLQTHDFVPTHIKEAYQSVVSHILEKCDQVFSCYGQLETIRLHGDCHPSNIMWTDDGPHFVDFDDCRSGPSIQDFWMLVNDNSSRGQWDALIEGYEDFREFDDRQFKIVEPLRAMRMLHYSAWLARRWQDPSFQHNFPWFNTNRYWEEQVLSLKEQLAVLLHMPSASHQY